MMETTSEQTRLEIPVAVQVVAWLMILTGVYAVLGIFVGLAHGSLFLNLKFLFLFVGIGLLRLRNGWRVCALAFIALGLVACAIAPLAALLSERPLPYRVFGTLVGCLPKWTLWVTLPQAAALLLFQAWILMRPGTRRLFAAEKDENTTVTFRKPAWAAFWVILLLVSFTAQAWYWEQHVMPLSEYLQLQTPVGVASGSIVQDDLGTGYMIVKFPSGKYGVAIVARSKGTAPVTPNMAKEGLARVWIDESLYEFPFSGEDVSDERVSEFLDQAIEKYREREKVDDIEP